MSFESSDRDPKVLTVNHLYSTVYSEMCAPIVMSNVLYDHGVESNPL